MPRHRRAVQPASIALTVLCLVLTTGCGAGDGAAEDGPAPLSDDTYQRVVGQGVDRALVYTIQLPGFDLAEQSAGVVGESDYGATYLPVDPPYTTEVSLEVRAGGYDDARCEREPLRGPTGAAPAAVESCEPEADGWYRTAGDQHEYVVAGAGHHLVLGGPAEAVDRDTLTAAALGARSQEGTGASPAQPSSPVTRGDLPTTGDGAPVDPRGTDRPGG